MDFYAELWFDVGIKRYTTGEFWSRPEDSLWFDVGIKRYTTHLKVPSTLGSCGLM